MKAAETEAETELSFYLKNENCVLTTSEKEGKEAI